MRVTGHADEKYVTGRRLGSSAGRGWTNVLAERWSHAIGELPSVLPRDTEIAVLLGGHTLVDREGAGLKQRNYGRRGTAWLCPAGIREDYIDFKQSVDDCLHIFLPAKPFADTMEQDLEVDPASVTLRYEVIADDPFVEQVALQIARELERETSAGRMLVEGLGQALSAYLANQCAERPVTARLRASREKPMDVRRALRVIDYIEANIDRGVTVAEIASVACMSPAHFARSFKATVGRAPHQYVSERRLDLAKELLVRTDRDVSDVAAASGFTSASNFARAFRTATGLSPTQFRLRRL